MNKTYLKIEKKGKLINTISPVASLRPFRNYMCTLEKKKVNKVKKSRQEEIIAPPLAICPEVIGSLTYFLITNLNGFSLLTGKKRKKKRRSRKGKPNKRLIKQERREHM